VLDLEQLHQMEVRHVLELVGENKNKKKAVDE